jgi:hypothetical protein
MWNFDAAENEFAPRNQCVNVVTDANVNHGGSVKILHAESEGK